MTTQKKKKKTKTRKEDFPDPERYLSRRARSYALAKEMLQRVQTVAPETSIEHTATAMVHSSIISWLKIWLPSNWTNSILLRGVSVVIHLSGVRATFEKHAYQRGDRFLGGETRWRLMRTVTLVSRVLLNRHMAGESGAQNVFHLAPKCVP
jgi:hypothetical protein